MPCAAWSRVRLLPLVCLALLALPATLPGPAAASTSCDFSRLVELPAGNARVSYYGHRCHFAAHGGATTQRLERIDVHAGPNGPHTGLVLDARETRHHDGSTTTRHAVSAELDGTRAEAFYFDWRSGRQGTCEAGVIVGRGASASPVIDTPPLPACAPAAALLP